MSKKYKTKKIGIRIFTYNSIVFSRFKGNKRKSAIKYNRFSTYSKNKANS